MARIKVEYGNFEPSAKENFKADSLDSQFDTLQQFQQKNITFPNYLNPCEYNSVVLDDSASPIPSLVDKKTNLGFWSEQLSDDMGVFETPVSIKFQSEKAISTQGITLTFDVANDVYATEVYMEWYKGEEQKATGTFYPNSAVYVCEKAVEEYDTINIAFYSINMPNNRLKLHSIEYGFGISLEQEVFKNIRIVQEINPISLDIPTNILNFRIEAGKDFAPLFKKKQEFKLYVDDAIKSTTVISSFKRISKNVWDIKTEDYIGILDDVDFVGGIYKNKNVAELIAEIFKVADVPYLLDASFADKTVSGHIPYTNCRSALMQVAFAIGAAVDTSNSTSVRIFPIDSQIKDIIPKDRIFNGQNIEESEFISGVELTSHEYEPTEEVVEIYKSTSQDIGKDIFIKFSEPFYDLSTTTEATDAPKIIEYGSNYAKIHIYFSGALLGKRYKHNTQTKIQDSGENIKRLKIEDATLVSLENVDSVLDLCYNYTRKNKTLNSNILERKSVRRGERYKYGSQKYGVIKYGEYSPDIVTKDKDLLVGDSVFCETEYMGDQVGIITRQDYTISGGSFTVKKTTMRC